MEINLSILDIKKILPHRYPFLLVDRVTYHSENEIKGYKNVSANESFFEGHFPEQPVMPGVLIVEALAQLGAIHTLSKEENKEKIAYLVGIDKVKIKQMVLPGDRLDLHVELISEKSSIGKAKITAFVNNKKCLTGEVTFFVK